MVTSQASQLCLRRMTSVEANWARGGTALYIYQRVGKSSGHEEDCEVDESAKAMIEKRRAAIQQSEAHKSNAETERALLRNALMACNVHMT